MAKTNFKRFSKITIISLSKAIGEHITGTQLSEIFKILRLSDTSKESTKWRRIDFVFNKYQTKDKNASTIVKIIEAIYAPVSYINDKDVYKLAVNTINKILITEGCQINDNGLIVFAIAIKNLDEISKLYNSLFERLTEEKVHSEVLKYCTKELVQENYFHSIFEAAKGLCERVREMSGVEDDGSSLFDKVFSINNPILRFNNLSDVSKKNQQNGLKEMMHGITHYTRNVTAHEPKIKWIIEEAEAVNVFTILSFLHKALDTCEKV